MVPGSTSDRSSTRSSSHQPTRGFVGARRASQPGRGSSRGRSHAPGKPSIWPTLAGWCAPSRSLSSPERPLRPESDASTRWDSPSYRSHSTTSKRSDSTQAPSSVVGSTPGSRPCVRAGLWEEVGGLLGRLGRTAQGAVGYRQLAAAHRGEVGIEEAWDGNPVGHQPAGQAAKDLLSARSPDRLATLGGVAA